jgi:two-component system, LytTR family, sensor kinase
LQKLRMAQPANVEFTVRGSMDDKRIAPMILIPFIENAFKHGNKTDSEHPIRFRLEIQPNMIVFESTNGIKAIPNTELVEGHGIGLRNVKRRLELIYPGCHRLEIETEATIYHVQLIINER